MISNQVAHYQIEEELGRGGMGVVYKARDTKLDRRVALKFLPQEVTSTAEDHARFLQEARAASALNHPNICAIHALGEYEGLEFIDMEYIEGKTLRGVIPVSNLEAAITFAIQIAEALQEAHAHGIVHRDIKTDNIMVTSNNQIKVLDFGLAKLKGSVRLTKTSSTVGTLAYMAPEQIQGGDADARSDIFSFGVVLYEMLTGHLPFKSEHEAALLYSIVNDEPEPIAEFRTDLPAEISHLLVTALQKDPAMRYQSIEGILVDLRNAESDPALVSSRTRAKLADRPEVLRRMINRGRGFRSRLFWIAAASAIGLAIILATFALLDRPGAPRLNPNPMYTSLDIPFKEVLFVSLSRDSKWIAFPAADALGAYDLYTLNTSTKDITKVSREKAYAIASAEISPDGSEISYDVIHAPPVAIRVVPFQGGAARTIADTGIFPRWRPDGKRIAYVRGGLKGTVPSRSGRLEIWSVRPDGTDNRIEFVDSVNASSEWAHPCCWSPDGESISWIRYFSVNHSEVMVRSVSSGKERQITAERSRLDQLQWAPNGMILFVSNRSGNSNLWLVSSEGGESMQLTRGVTPVGCGTLSADTKKLVYLQSETIQHLWVSTAEGSANEELTSDDCLVQHASLSPDKDHISAVIGDADWQKVERHLFVMDRDGKNRRKLTSGEIIVGRSRWSFDGKWLAYSVRPVSVPAESTDICLIQPFSPSVPRRLGRGKDAEWINDENIAVWTGTKTIQYSLEGRAPFQLYEDSTFAIPIRNGRQILFRDFRTGREGMWRVDAHVDGKRIESPSLLARLPEFMEYAIPVGGEFVLSRMHGTEPLWRVQTSTGRTEAVGKALHPTAWIQDVSVDGQLLLWIRESFPARVVLEENVFE